MTIVTEMSSAQMPGTMKKTSVWSNDGSEGMKMEFNGKPIKISGKVGEVVNIQLP